MTDLAVEIEDEGYELDGRLVEQVLDAVEQRNGEAVAKLL
jgi:hypothetical protein